MQSVWLLDSKRIRRLLTKRSVIIGLFSWMAMELLFPPPKIKCTFPAHCRPLEQPQMILSYYPALPPSKPLLGHSTALQAGTRYNLHYVKLTCIECIGARGVILWGWGFRYRAWMALWDNRECIIEYRKWRISGYFEIMARVEMAGWWSGQAPLPTSMNFQHPSSSKQEKNNP